MFIISVIPIARKVGSETLSYYTATKPIIGSVIDCPLKKSTIQALVIDVRNIREAKYEIRSADFTIRKIDTAENQRKIYAPAYLVAIYKTSSYYASPLSYVLTELTPKYLLENKFTIEDISFKNKVKHPTQYIEGQLSERISEIKKIIIGSEGLTHIIVPTVSEIIQLKELLIDTVPIFTFSSNQTNKTILVQLQELQALSTCVVISTTQYLCFTQNKVTRIILESYNDNSYILSRSYNVDMRYFVEEYALLSGIEIYQSDLFLLSSSNISTSVTNSKVKKHLIDMTLENNKKMIWKSALLDSALKSAKQSGSNSFLYVTRLGMFPITNCQDCGQIVLCECGSPLVLHVLKTGQRYYQCHACKKVTDLVLGTEVRCNSCNSWKLSNLGVGIQSVAEDLRSLGYTVFELHSDFVKTPKQVQKIIESFEKTPGSVLVGTDLAVRHLKTEVPLVAVVTIDSVLSVPDLRTDFTVLYSLVKLQSLSSSYFIIQTRLPNIPIFRYFLKDAINTWKENYLHDLKTLEYPPFGVLIIIAAKLKPSIKDTRLLEELFNVSLDWQNYNGRWYTEQKISKTTWLNDIHFSYKLSNLPSYFEVKIF